MPILISNTGLGGRLKVSGNTTGGFKARYVVPLLLDVYPSAATAYSLRKLSSTYSGAAIRVRRSSDNTETDIVFVNNVLDTTTLLTFCGAGNGFVTTWYDQSGNANNAVQATASLQGRIVNAGAITYQNGKPVIDFYGAGIFYTYNPVLATGDWSLYLVQKRPSAATQGILLANTSGGLFFTQNSDNNFYIQRVTGTTGFYKFAADSTATFCVLSGYNISNVTSAYKNNIQYSLSADISFGATSVTSYNSIGNYNGLAQSAGYVCEIIIYANNQTSNKTAIESNINSYYSIY
jgi:hypothetical protein